MSLRWETNREPPAIHEKKSAPRWKRPTKLSLWPLCLCGENNRGILARQRRNQKPTQRRGGRRGTRRASGSANLCVLRVSALKILRKNERFFLVVVQSYREHGESPDVPDAAERPAHLPRRASEFRTLKNRDAAAVGAAFGSARPGHGRRSKVDGSTPSKLPPTV